VLPIDASTASRSAWSFVRILAAAWSHGAGPSQHWFNSPSAADHDLALLNDVRPDDEDGTDCPGPQASPTHER
jgi:hypothetical protein